MKKPCIAYSLLSKAAFLFAVLFLVGCMKNEFPIKQFDLSNSRGVFILNEGNYLYSNGSLSFYDLDTREVFREIYFSANGVPLGDVVSSMEIFNGKGFIVVNNSSCIRVVDINTLQYLGTISNLPSPRNILFLSDSVALVSDLYARGISIVNPITLSVGGRIETGDNSLPFFQHSSENLIRIENKVFANSWSFDNKVIVICADSLKIIDKIDVGIQPMIMVKDKNNNLWVLNDGGYSGNPFGYEIPSLMRINSATHEVELTIAFNSLNDKVGQIATNPSGDSLYFICNHLYKMHIDDELFPNTPLIEANGKNFRALATHPETGEIYISDAMDFMSEGMVYRYSPGGRFIDAFTAGIIPGNFCFK